MSEYKFSCPHCSQHLAGTADWAGRVLQCPSCQKEFTVPLPTPPAAAPVATAAAAPPSLLSPGGLRIKGGGSPAAASVAAPETLAATSPVEERVLAGGRYVIFQYCISILIMSFRRPSGIVYVPPGKDGGGAAIGHSVISLFFGWWGIPWGPIWTISTIFKNARGGTDVTQEVLAAEVGAPRAASIMARRRIVPAALGTGMIIFRVIAAIVGLWVLFTIAMIVWSVAKGVHDGLGASKPPPAAVAQAGGFESANANINVNHGTIAFGNSPQAVAVASEFATMMRPLTKDDGGSGFSATKHEFLTHCELREGSCALIVHVPGLRNFSTDDQAKIGSLAWAGAQASVAKSVGLKPGMKFAVGLRGVMLYNRVLLGHQLTDAKDKEAGLEQTITSSHPESTLASFFR